MIFTSFEFAIFFVLVLLLRAAIPLFSAEKAMLLVASYFFYMSWNPWCGFLILFTSMLDYYVGIVLARTASTARRRLLLTLSMVANLSVLGFFKYNNFFLDNAWALLITAGMHPPHWHLDIILPVGISFFTFQSMSYTVDVYRRQIPACTNLRDFLLFVSFFPQLVAGPIVRASDFLPQLFSRVRGSGQDIQIGLAQFCVGALKKMVISDQVAGNVDLIFAAPQSYDALTLLQGLLGYAVQIYCDFSGYSDMAIGCARIMGLRFMENFQMPYSAVNITEFWRRWHISLSTWLRDYLYIPLGGNRRGTARMYLNLFLTMLLGGLWHGASWNFVFWGGLHGVALASHKAYTGWAPAEVLRTSRVFTVLESVLSRLFTLVIVLVGWIFFRAQSWDSAITFLLRLATWSTDGTRLISPYILPAFGAVFLTHLLINKDRNWTHEIPTRGWVYQAVAFTILLTVLITLGATDSAPFIYFQF